MAGLIGWWCQAALERPVLKRWLAGTGGKCEGEQASPFDEAGWILLAGPGRQLEWEADGLGVIVLGRPRWRGSAVKEETLAELVRLFQSRGPDCLTELRGSFLVCFLDRSKGKGLVAIDRVGSFPLAFALGSGFTVFGTDARCVASHPSVAARVSQQALFSYLYAHMVPSPDTIFEGVAKLQPGQYLAFGPEGGEVGNYWRMPYAAGAAGNFEEAAERFRGLLRQGVRRCLDEAPFGSFLSGGTDSSTVSGLVSELSGRPAEAYSIGFDAEGFDETEYARLAAKHFGCNLHEYYVTPADVRAAIPQVAAAYDEPFGNASAVPAYLCARRAAQDGRTILLAGDGGDEIFGGNARYAKQKVFEAYWAIPGVLRRGLEPLALGTPMFTLGPMTKVRSYISQARVPLPDRLETYNFLEREDLVEVFDPDFLAAIDRGRPAEIARASYAEAPAGQSINRMMHLDLKQTLADNDLRKVVRMCALAGVEARFPLLDDDLVEFAAGLPEHWKVKGLKLRWFFKEALKDFLPREIITKSKHGFGLPFGLWMSTDPQLQALAYDSLQQLRNRKVLNAAYLDRLIELHRTGHASYYGVMIWVLMMLEQWLQANQVALN